MTQIGRIEPPIARAVPAAHLLAREHIRRSEKLHDLFFREMPEYPEFAWQEAIVNAFAHRNYEVQGLEIEVWFYDDRVSRHVAVRELHRLVDEEFLRMEGERRGARYLPGPRFSGPGGK